MRQAVDYLMVLGVLHLAQEPLFRPVIVRGKELACPLDHVFLEMPAGSSSERRQSPCGDANQAGPGTLSDNVFVGLIGELIETGVLDVTLIANGLQAEPDQTLARLQLLKQKDFAVKLVIANSPLPESLMDSLALLNLELLVVDLGIVPAAPEGYTAGSDWAACASRLRAARERGIHVGVKMKVLNAELDQLEQALDLVAPIGAKKIWVQVPRSWSALKGGIEEFTPDITGQLATRLMTELNRLEGQQLQSPEIRLGDVCPHTELFPGCGVGVNSCLIRANGDVGLCPHFDNQYIAGNIRAKPLDEVWLTAEVFQMFRGHSLTDIAKCTQCFYQSRCRGGCIINTFDRGGGVINMPDLLSCSFYEGIAIASPTYQRTL